MHIVAHSWETPLGVQARKVIDKIVITYDDAALPRLQVDAFVQAFVDGTWQHQTGEIHALDALDTQAFVDALPIETMPHAVLSSAAALVLQSRGAGAVPNLDPTVVAGG